MVEAQNGAESIRDFAAFVDALTAREDSLPKRLGQVTQFFLNNPEDVAIYNIVGLSKLAGAPTATITRFAKEMGFSGFVEMQNVFRQRLVGPRMSYADRLRALSEAAENALDSELDLKQPAAIFDTFIQTGIDSLLRLREAVRVAAARGAFGIGAYTFYGLSKIGKPAHMIDNLGSMRTAQINAVGKPDAVSVMTFDDYTPETIAVAERAASCTAHDVRLRHRVGPSARGRREPLHRHRPLPPTAAQAALRRGRSGETRRSPAPSRKRMPGPGRGGAADPADRM